MHIFNIIFKEEKHLSSSHSAATLQLSPTLLCGIIFPQREEPWESELCTTWRQHRRHPPPPDWRQSFCFFLKDYLRWVSLPPTVALFHLRPAAAGVAPPTLRFSQPLCTISFQRTLWLLNAFGLKDIWHHNLSLYHLYLYSSFTPEPAGECQGFFCKGWRAQIFKNVLRGGHTVLLIETALSYKVKLLRLQP